jgi:predicted nucleic acid-binding Zn finger protein
MSKELKDFANLCTKIKERGYLTSDDKEALYNIFGEKTERALEIVFLNRVKKYKFVPSNTTFWIVIGKTNEYLVIPESRFCACDDFLFSFFKGEQPYCIHLIAQKIAEALGEVKEIEESDGYYAPLIEEFVNLK